MIECGRAVGESIAIRQKGVTLATVTIDRINGEMVHVVAEGSLGIECRRAEAIENGTPISPPGGRTILTTGRVAKLLKVAPRTVNQWVDKGRLKGYRLPGSKDRRVPWSAVVEFAREHGLPLEDFMHDPVPQSVRAAK